jgi:ferredoxin
MPKIKFNDKDAEIQEGENPHETFEKLGMDFSCENGVCGTCKMKVLSGMENINQKTDEENDFPLDDDERLGCQCRELAGDVEIEYEEW